MASADDFRRELVALLPRLRRFATALTGSSAEAEDLLQAAVEKALRAEDRFKPGTRLDSWMFRIVQNAWIDETRAARRRAAPLEEASHVVGEDGREVAGLSLDAAAARAAMAALSPDQRAVAALVLVDGLSYKEAAETLQVPIGTVMSRLSRARAAVVAKLTRGVVPA